MGTIDKRKKLIQLIDQYQNLVFSICLKMTGDYFAAEDLAQDTYLLAYKHLDSFDGAAEKAWLCRIASNRCIDYLRAKERQVTCVDFTERGETGDFEQAGAVPECTDEPFASFSNKEIIKELCDCIEKLPPPYCEVAREYFLHERSAKEIALMTGDKLKTIQTRIYRAREMLRKTYRKELLV